MERWEKIKGYTGYEISNMGRVRSTKRYKEGKILALNTNKRGYVSICLWKNNVGKTYRLHRLVALAFIPKIEGKELINHKNGIKSDNRVSNLEWCNQKENIKHAIDNGYCDKRIEEKRKPIKCSNGMIFKSSYEAAMWLYQTKYSGKKKVKTMASKIRQCVLGYKSSIYGYKWTRV